MKLRNAISCLLAAAMLVTLCGCEKPAEEVTGESTDTWVETEPQTAVDKQYFGSPWRMDVDFNDMQYEHYELSRYDEFTQPIYDLAENGGTAEDFQTADYLMYEELAYVYTLYMIKSIESYRYPSDSEIQSELLYITDVAYDVYDECISALQTMASSEYYELMEVSYDESAISSLRDYESPTDEERELYSEEDALIQDYYMLMAEDEPDYDALAELYVRLVAIKNEEAQLYGYGSYAEYAYESVYYREYTPTDAELLWQYVKDYIVPLLGENSSGIEEKFARLYYSNEIDCSQDAVLESMAETLPKISQELVDAYDYMTRYNLCDCETGADKTDISFTALLYYANEPYIFTAGYDSLLDYSGLYHEFGHFVNYFYNESDLIFGAPDNDLCELQSQGMEAVFTFFYDDIFGSENADTMRNYMLLDLLYGIVEGAIFDEFQQRVYAEPDLTPDKVNEIYESVLSDYEYDSGYVSGYSWIEVPHNFEMPFYYISYAVSALGTLELYEMCREDWDTGIDTYLSILALNTEVSAYSDVYGIDNFGDIFSENTYKKISENLF